MKNIIKIGIILLLCAIIGVTLSTATSNDKLPTKDQVTNFISEMKSSSASDIFSKVKSDHPAWNADLLTCSTCSGSKEAIALYYTDSGSKGYGSIYVKDGEIVTSGSLKGYTLKDSYKGELKESINETEENASTQPKENNSTVIKDDETEKNSGQTYEDFTKALDAYDGKTGCKSLDCAQSLSDYFKGKGWSTEVRYCVAVTTSDEGTVYVVLGA